MLRGGSLVLCLSASDLAFGATILAVRVWPAADYTRVTIESDQPLLAHHFLAEAPYRLVVDIDNLELSPALRDLVGKVRPDDPYIAGVRVGQNQPHVVRLVLDLKQPVAPQQFALDPVAAYQHRLVFDLYPARKADPVLALLRGKDQAETQAAQSVQDALGEFIGRSGGRLRRRTELSGDALEQPRHRGVDRLGEVEAHDALGGEHREGVAEGRRCEVVSEGHASILARRSDVPDAPTHGWGRDRSGFFAGDDESHRRSVSPERRKIRGNPPGIPAVPYVAHSV